MRGRKEENGIRGMKIGEGEKVGIEVKVGDCYPSTFQNSNTHSCQNVPLW